MLPVTFHTLVEKYCKLTQKWALIVSFDYPDEDDAITTSVFLDELILAAPVLKSESVDIHDVMQIVTDGQGAILFDNEKEMNEVYQTCVGDNGPTEVNSYDGPVRVYALTCGPDGFLNENT